MDEQVWATIKDWSPYLVLAVYIGWKERDAIKNAIAQFYQDRRSDDKDRREFNQDLHQAEVEAELQTRATHESREWWSLEKFSNLIQEHLRWIREEFRQMQQVLQFQAARQTRVEDKILLMSGTLAEMNERLRRIEQYVERN